MLFSHVVAGTSKFKSVVDPMSRSQVQRNFLQNPFPFFTRFISDVTNPNFTVDYLTNSCGLSPEASLKISKRIVLKSTQRPDTVLSLLNTHGLTKSDISTLIKNFPSILLSDPDKILKPKLEYLSKIGVPGTVIVKMGYLPCSLEKHIIPSINYLRSLVGSYSDVISILKKSRWELHNVEYKIGSNIAILRNHGVPESNITKSIMIYPDILCINTDLFKEKVSEIVKIGFCPSSMMFFRGLKAFVEIKKHKWDERMDFYRSLGWSDGEILSMFRKQPGFMTSSEKKISLALDFFTNSWNCTRQDISCNLSVISLSLEKRIIPRCYVLQILHSKNLISKDCVGTALRINEASFLKRYVNQYHSEVPDLLTIYQTKMGMNRR